MIKYLDLNGYTNLGMIAPHVYQFIEKDVQTPKVILVHAYECPAEAFKGFIFQGTKTFTFVPFETEELQKLEAYVGNCKVMKDFNEFTSSSVLGNENYENVPGADDYE